MFMCSVVAWSCSPQSCSLCIVGLLCSKHILTSRLPLGKLDITIHSLWICPTSVPRPLTVPCLSCEIQENTDHVHSLIRAVTLWIIGPKSLTYFNFCPVRPVSVSAGMHMPPFWSTSNISCRMFAASCCATFHRADCAFRTILTILICCTQRILIKIWSAIFFQS